MTNAVCKVNTYRLEHSTITTCELESVSLYRCDNRAVTVAISRSTRTPILMTNEGLNTAFNTCINVDKEEKDLKYLHNSRLVVRRIEANTRRHKLRVRCCCVNSRLSG